MQAVSVRVVSLGFQLGQDFLDIGVHHLFVNARIVGTGVTVGGIEPVGDAFLHGGVGLGLGNVLSPDHGGQDLVAPLGGRLSVGVGRVVVGW